MIKLNKKTSELLKMLKNKGSITSYICINKDEFIEASLSEYLNSLLCEYNINKTKAIEKSNLNNIYAYEIFSGKKKPSRDKLIQPAFGMELNLLCTQRLLKVAGHSELYPRIKRDSIIIFAVNNSLSLIECNELLYDMNEDILD